MHMHNHYTKCSPFFTLYQRLLNQSVEERDEKGKEAEAEGQEEA